VIQLSCESENTSENTIKHALKQARK